MDARTRFLAVMERAATEIPHDQRGLTDCRIRSVAGQRVAWVALGERLRVVMGRVADAPHLHMWLEDAQGLVVDLQRCPALAWEPRPAAYALSSLQLVEEAHADGGPRAVLFNEVDRPLIERVTRAALIELVARSVREPSAIAGYERRGLPPDARDQGYARYTASHQQQRPAPPSPPPPVDWLQEVRRAQSEADLLAALRSGAPVALVEAEALRRGWAQR